MTREEAISLLTQVNHILVNSNSWLENTHEPLNIAFNMAIKALEQEPTPKNDLAVDCISRKAALDITWQDPSYSDPLNVLTEVRDKIRELPSVTPQEPRCKECKWWKDSDGEYRRGCGAGSRCPINRREVFEGNGYCYLFEPQDSEVEG